MKITFPHMGNVYIPVKIIFNELNVEYVMPPLNNKSVLELGCKYSPEEMCLPFKYIIGNYIQGLQNGADTVLLLGSCGPCRFGEYGEVIIRILKSLGYNPEFILIDSPQDIGMKELLKRASKIVSSTNKSNTEIFNACIHGLNALNLIEKIEKRAHFLAGYELNKGECKSILHVCKQDVIKAENSKEIMEILKQNWKRINSIKIDKNKNPIHIQIIGEIYTIIDPYTNLDIEDKLMDYEVSSSRKLTPVWWIKDFIMKVLKLNSLDIRIASKEYLPFYVGGHTRECIGEAVLGSMKDFDGAIQIFPMGCMPEIVAKAILPTISKDKDFPIMTLIIDEMTGQGGYITRIEAFIDLLLRKREKNNLKTAANS